MNKLFWDFVFLLVAAISFWLFFTIMVSEMFVAIFEPRPAAVQRVRADGFIPLDPEAMEQIRSEYGL